MKVESKKYNVQESKNFDRLEIKLGENADAFVLDMISSGIYSNPIGSIVREIASNCYDGHIAIGQIKPFEIEFIKKNRLIGQFENKLIFRDFGIGLDKQRIIDIYVNIFESDKREDENQTGYYGIGSKSPFAYSDSFNLITYVNGIKTIYQLQKISETKIDLIILNEEKTDLNQTEVIISVKDEDIESFEKEINDQLFYFKNLVVKGFEFKGANVMFETDNLIACSGNQDRQSGVHIVLGNVKYPLNLELIEVKNWNYYNSPFIGLKFKIGELRVSTNREAVRYTPETIKKIQSKIKQAQKEIIQYLKDLFKKETKFLKFLKMYSNLNQSDDYLGRMYQFCKNENIIFKFKDISISEINNLGINVLEYSTRSYDKKLINYSTDLSGLYRNKEEYSVYYTDSQLSSYKNGYLIKINPKGYVIVKLDESKLNFEKLNDTEKTKKIALFNEVVGYIKAEGVSYDNVVVDTTIMTDKDKKDSLSAKEIRKQNKEIFVKECKPNRRRYGGNRNKYEFFHISVKPEYFKTNDKIIWGYNEDSARLEQAAYIRENIELDSKSVEPVARVFKIAKNNTDIIKRFKDNINVNDIFVKKDNFLVKYYTAFKINLVINDYDYLQCFQPFNSNIYDKYKELITYRTNYFQDSLIANHEWQEQLMLWLDENKVYDEKIIYTLEEVLDYCKDLEIFRYFTQIHEEFKDLEQKHVNLIVDILKLKNKVVTFTEPVETLSTKAVKKGHKAIMNEFLAHVKLRSFNKKKSGFTRLNSDFYSFDRGDYYYHVIDWINEIPLLKEDQTEESNKESKEIKEKEVEELVESVT